ncbi:TrbC/VirB2 family protein [Wolbachia endosymbiont of Trichogramma kaykai]
MSYIIKKLFNALCVVMFLSFSDYVNAADNINDATAQVICNIIGYIWAIGGPLMTIVIIGAALLAIFGRMPWPAMFALVVFCGVFFGAKTIMMRIIPNITTEAKDMLDKCGK